MLTRLRNQIEYEYAKVLEEKLFPATCIYHTPSGRDKALSIFSLWNKTMPYSESNTWNFDLPVGIKLRQMECYIVAYGAAQWLRFNFTEMYETVESNTKWMETQGKALVDRVSSN